MLLDIYFLRCKILVFQNHKSCFLRITESCQMILIKMVDMPLKNLFAKREIHILRENYFSPAVKEHQLYGKRGITSSLTLPSTSLQLGLCRSHWRNPRPVFTIHLRVPSSSNPEWRVGWRLQVYSGLPLTPSSLHTRPCLSSANSQCLGRSASRPQRPEPSCLCRHLAIWGRKVN